MTLVRVQLPGRNEAESTCLTLRNVTRDGELTWLLCCPGCGEWGEVDDDQFHGRVSIDHTGQGPRHDCGFHETHDIAAYLVGALTPTEEEE